MLPYKYLKPRPEYAILLIFLEFLVAGIIAPYITDYSLDFFDGNYSRTSLMTGLAQSGGAFFIFVVGPIYGALSDSKGRRRYIIMFTLLGSLPSLCLAAGISLWFYLGAQIAGGASTFGLVFAYIADLTEGDKRTRFYGYVMVAIFAPIAIGPLIALPLNQTWAFRASGLMSLITIFYASCILPESLHAVARLADENAGLLKHSGALSSEDNSDSEEALGSHDSPAHSQRSVKGQGQKYDSLSTTPTHSRLVCAADVEDNADETSSTTPAGTVTSLQDLTADDLDDIPPPPPLARQRSYNPLAAIKYVTRSEGLTQLAVLLTIVSLAENGIIDTILLYLKRRLDFNDTNNAIFLFIVGVSVGVLLFFVFPRISKKYGERNVIILSVSVNCVRLLLYCFMNQKWQVYALETTGGFSFMSFPAGGIYAAKMTSPHEQGLVQGAISGIRGLTSGVGPLLFNGAFSLFTSDRVKFQFPQAPFVMAVLMLAGGIGLAYRLPQEPRDLVEAEVAKKQAELLDGQKDSGTLDHVVVAI